ncbi:MAG TPA: ATP-binding protein [Flavobacterium sp.]|jgi:signal transduction histidine kinase
MLYDVAFGIIIVLIFISLVVLFCVLLGKLYIHKIKNYTRLIYQKDIDFQKVLNTTIMETQEQVLNNISQDLHDDTGQQITYINFQIENLRLDSAVLYEALEPLSQSVQQLSSSIRSISHSLNNQMVLQQDLIKAIKTETERLEKNGRLEIEFLCTEGRGKFSTEEKILIYRIFQEIISNVLKHSKATKINIDISFLPLFRMEIRDNGKGFDPKAISGNVSLGLKGMQERAAIINYDLTVDSTIGKGTVVTISEKQLV